LEEDENGGLSLLEYLVKMEKNEGPSFDFWKENGEK